MTGPVLWSAATIADAIADGLEGRAEAEDVEQAVYGFDARDELGLHPLIQQALTEAGFGVWPEQRYPGDRTRRKRSEGKRCDIVLTHDRLPLRDSEVRDTLFDDQPACDPQEAYWLEIKTIAQFETEGPFRGYSKELMTPVVGDIKKLWSDGVICYAGLCLVMFNATDEVAEHDVTLWHERCMDRGYPIAPPALRGFAITDRIGNGWCTVAVFSVRGA